MTLPHSVSHATRWLLLACLAGAAPVATSGVLFAISTAGAQDKAVTGEVIVILASEDAGQIDAELKQMEALRKPPFNGFKSMKVLRKQKLALTGAKPITADLPNGRKMQVEVLEVAKDGRYKVRVSINKPDTKDYLPGMVVAASAGEPFFVAGQKHDGGTLVIGIRVGDRGAAGKPTKDTKK